MEVRVGLLRKLFGPMPEPVVNAPVEQEIDDRLKRGSDAIIRIFTPQIEHLGYLPGTIPANSVFASLNARAAILGTVRGILAGEGLGHEGMEFEIDSYHAAFTLIYGPAISHPLMAEAVTIENEWPRTDQSFEMSSYSNWAMNDTIGVYKTGYTSTMAYALVVQGHKLALN